MAEIDEYINNNNVIKIFLDKPVVYISSPISLEETSSFDYFVSIINYLAKYVNSMLNSELIIKMPIGINTDNQISLLDYVIKNE